MLKIGERIPVFEGKLDAFQDDKIKRIDLEKFPNKWLVLLFYPADFTFVCPTELKEASDYYQKFKKVGAEILSISTDTVYVHKAWHDSSPIISRIKFPMVADPTGSLCRIYGAYIKDEGVSIRATVIIDPKKIIRFFEMHDNSIGRNMEEIFRKLQASQYVNQHKNEVCPASWKPGGKTLKPGLNLVGKI